MSEEHTLQTKKGPNRKVVHKWPPCIKVEKNHTVKQEHMQVINEPSAELGKLKIIGLEELRQAAGDLCDRLRDVERVMGVLTGCCLYVEFDQPPTPEWMNE